jgi:hypothetical protein
MNQFEPDFFKPYDDILKPDGRNVFGHRYVDDALQKHYSLIEKANLSGNPSPKIYRSDC